MVFNSLAFLGFLVPVLILYYVLPGRHRAWWVLLASLTFYAFYNWKVVPFLIVYALLVHGMGLLISRRAGRGKTAAAVIVALLPLIIAKYSGFALSVFGAEMTHSLVLPLGISYFTFKSVSYLVDIKKGKAEAERDPIVTMAFVTFFPEILTGPIDRAGNLMTQLRSGRPHLAADEAQRGALLFLAGCFQKMVIADRIGLYVDAVYGNPDSTAGLAVVAAALGYSLQIYFDFAGCTLMALGVGRLLGFDLPRNFRRPYLGTSVADFWRRWHISLTSWLRDYVYIPLGGNRKGTVRKYINILIVFLVSGLWHGAGWTFVIWGLINGALQVAEGCLGGRNRTRSKHLMAEPSQKKHGPAVWLKRLWVFLLMTVAWVFFRAPSLAEAGRIFGSMGIRLPDEACREILAGTGLGRWDVLLMAVILIVCLIIALTGERGEDLLDRVVSRPFIVRCLIFYVLIFSVILFGIYGTAYDAASFIYMQF